MKQYLSAKWIVSIFAILIFLLWILSIFWSVEPDLFEPESVAQQQAAAKNERVVIGYTTTTSLKQLSEDERIVEIAEMLSGKIISDSALTHAKELLN